MGLFFAVAEKPETNMAVANESWEETAAPASEIPEIKLFGKWASEDVQVSDISLTDYIAIKEKYAKFTPHSAGRYQVKRFRKAQCPIVERLTCSLMMHGRNNGKKLMAMRIVKHSFEIIHLLTGENPLQIWSRPSSTVDPVRILPVSAALVPSGARPWTCHH